MCSEWGQESRSGGVAVKTEQTVVSVGGGF